MQLLQKSIDNASWKFLERIWEAVSKILELMYMVEPFNYIFIPLTALLGIYVVYKFLKI